MRLLIGRAKAEAVLRTFVRTAWNVLGLVFLGGRFGSEMVLDWMNKGGLWVGSFGLFVDYD